MSHSKRGKKRRSMPLEGERRCIGAGKVIESTSEASIYARWSPRPNSEACESEKWQIDECMDFLEQHGIALGRDLDDEPMIRSDPDISGREEDRDNMWELIDWLRPGRAIVCFKLDRFVRGVYLSAVAERAVRDSGGALLSTMGEGTWNDDDEDRLIRDILRVFDDYTRRASNKRLSAAMRRHQRNGRAMGGTPPYGKRFGTPVMVKGGEKKMTLIPDYEELEAIDVMIKRKQAGDGPRRIADYMNTKTPYRKRGGGKWEKVQVARILKRAEQDGEI